ncbi:MAG: hypothetical protein GY820_30525, partial [Gammaproteobacteria bacterium]|nr:hypothetical protein [Gammaproteobacteria bacterium]
GANSTLLGNTSEIITAMDAAAMQQMLDAMLQKQETSRKADLQKSEENRKADLQKQEETLQKLEENRQTDLQKLEENRQGDLERLENNRAADQDRFSEALQLIEQRQDAVENLFNKNGGDEQGSLHNASVSRVVQRDEVEEVSSDEEGERQSRKDQNGRHFKHVNDSLKKGKTRTQSTSQDARR